MKHSSCIVQKSKLQNRCIRIKMQSICIPHPAVPDSTAIKQPNAFMQLLCKHFAWPRFSQSKCKNLESNLHDLANVQMSKCPLHQPTSEQARRRASHPAKPGLVGACLPQGSRRAPRPIVHTLNRISPFGSKAQCASTYGADSWDGLLGFLHRGGAIKMAAERSNGKLLILTVATTRVRYPGARSSPRCSHPETLAFCR